MPSLAASFIGGLIVKLTISSFCGRTWFHFVTLVMFGGSIALTSGCASGPREWVAGIVPKWGSDKEADKKGADKKELAKNDKAKSDKDKAKQSAKTKEAVDALVQNSERAKAAKEKAKAKDEEGSTENQSSKSKSFKPGDPRSQIATSTKVKKDKDAADKDKETTAARKPVNKTKSSEDVIADRLSKPADKATAGRVRGVMGSDDPFGTSTAKTDKPASKKKSADVDPFADDAAVASVKPSKDIRVPTAKKTADIKPSEDPASLDELDREMAAMGLEKKPAAKKPRAPAADVVSSDHLKELLNDEREEENVAAAAKGKSRTVSHEEQADNPFAEFEKGTTETKVESAAAKKTVKPAPKTEKKVEKDELLEDMFDEKPAASEKPAPKASATKTPKNNTRDLPRLNEGDEQEVLPPEDAEALEEPVAPKAAKSKKKAATPRDQADELMLQALAAFKKNQTDEACSLVESAVELEQKHELVYEEGEERPSVLLKRLNQLRSPSKKATSTKAAPVTTPPPSEESLPALSPEVQPIEDERQSNNDPFKPEKKVAAGHSDDSHTRTASLEQNDLSQGGISRVSANHPVKLPPLPGDKSAAKLSKTDGKACDSKSTAEDPFLLDADAQHELATTREEYKHASQTAHAGVTDNAVAPPSLKRRSNAAALILTGVSLASLGLSGLILWRHMQNKQHSVTLAGRPATQADNIHNHKS